MQERQVLILRCAAEGTVHPDTLRARAT